MRIFCRVATVVVACSVLISLAAVYELLKPVPNGCEMTYMYPTYVPIPPPDNVTSEKYGLFLYREGWSEISFEEHRKRLNGVPVLFIPGNGGSYKQVRSLGKESNRAYQAGPLERQFYEVYPSSEEGIGSTDVDAFKRSKRYTRMLDWFAVNLEGELSAMDSQILEEHTQYVVYAIQRILDQYKESHKRGSKEGAKTSRHLPRSVILVGHSMGGFVARAATIHPTLRKGAIETILTLSSPHQSPPLALQPSLAHYYSRVNREWRQGYEVQTAGRGPEPRLSNVVVISVSGGIKDYQVRSNLESLDKIVPATHGFMIGSTGMKNVWLSMEHQVILWCNQLVVQVSHTLLSLIDSERGLPFGSTHKRMYIFTKMLWGGIPQSFHWMRQHPFDVPKHVPQRNERTIAESQIQTFSPCPKAISWSSDGLENDLNIQTTTFTVSAMDGRRRWLDIQKLGSPGRNHFLFVTNLTPCSGVRLHLWPVKGEIISEVPIDNRIVEVTSKMVRIPTGPAPRQTGPGSRTDPPPSSIFWLDPEEMRGFRFLTISVAAITTASGREALAASMGVGQFFNSENRKIGFSRKSLLISLYSQQEISLLEDHPLSLDLSFSISLGLLPVALSLTPVSCGTKKSELPVKGKDDEEHNSLYKLCCFPPVVVSWDSTSGVQIIPNFYNETIVVDSSPASLSSTKGSEGTAVLLMLDPRCSYNISVGASISTAALRFVLLYWSQIVGFSFALVFFVLMRQTCALELDLPVPSTLTSVESNLIMPLSFLCLGVLPIVGSFFISLPTSQTFPPFAGFFTISIICYAFSNGFVIIVIMITQLFLHIAANVHIFFKKRCQVGEHVTLSTFFSLKAVRMVIDNQAILTAALSFIFACFIHPALGLFILHLSHTVCCHKALCSFLAASSPSHTNKQASVGSSKDNERSSRRNRNLPLEDNCQDNPTSEKSYSNTQLDIFNYCHGMLILHFLAALMFVPSFIAWLQKNGTVRHCFPETVDLTLCIGIIFHALYGWKPGFSSLSFSLPRQVGMSFVYLLAGYHCYFSGLTMAPYGAFYAMAAVGVVSSVLRLTERRRQKRQKQHGH